MSNPDLPLISVIVPCYNHTRYLSQAVESVLGQTYSQVEVVIVDDGSTDSSRTVAAEYALRFPDQVRAFSQPNQGVGPARDLGIANARGTWILPLDSDDYLHPEALDAMLNYANAHPVFDLIYCNYIRVDDQGHLLPDHRMPLRWTSLEGDILPALLPGGYFGVSWLCRRDRLLADVGGFTPVTENIVGHEDYLFAVRALLAGWQFGFLDRPLLYYRRTPGSLSSQPGRNEARLNALRYANARAPERMLHAVEACVQAAANRIWELEQHARWQAKQTQSWWQAAGEANTAKSDLAARLAKAEADLITQQAQIDQWQQAAVEANATKADLTAHLEKAKSDLAAQQTQIHQWQQAAGAANTAKADLAARLAKTEADLAAQQALTVRWKARTTHFRSLLRQLGFEEDDLR